MEKTTTSTDSRITEYREEFTRWFNVLEKYHRNRFDVNYRQYTSNNSTQGTTAKISDPIAPEQVERVIQKMFKNDPKFIVFARGKNIPKEITDIVSSTAAYYWTCPERVMISGSMKSKLKLWGREFCVLGNLATESYYEGKSDTPDARIIPVEDVIFDPTKSLKTSDVYYVRQYVSVKYLEDNIETTDKNGIVRGIFKKAALEKIKKLHEDKQLKQDQRSNYINRAGKDVYERVADAVELVSRWEGKKVCRVADWLEILQEATDPLNIQDHPFQFAMDIEVPKEPYAFSLLDYISGITHGKDLILNQIIDYGSKALNPPMFVDPSIAPVNRVTLRNAYKLGGIVFARPDQVEHKSMPPLPAEGFNLLNYLQQRAEQASGIGAYLGGVPNQASDKTMGTATGINTLTEQAQSPVQDRQQNIEESIIEPMMNKWLKIAGNLMGENEIKYTLITGQSPQWVKLTKGILTGKITLPDLLTAGLMDEETAAEVAQELELQGKDPNKELLFDADWIIRVETGSMAQNDKQEELQNFDSTIQTGIQMGLPIDTKKAWIERAIKAGIKEPEQYLMEQQPMGMGGMPGQPPQPGMPTQPGMPPQQGMPPQGAPAGMGMIGSTPIQ